MEIDFWDNGLVETLPEQPATPLSDALDLRFDWTGKYQGAIARGYQLYSAVCARIPQLHELQSWALIVEPQGFGIRCEPALLSTAAKLSGQSLEISGKTISLGAGQIVPLADEGLLYAPIAIAKDKLDKQELLDCLQAEARALGIDAAIALQNRRVMSICGSKIVGYEAIALGSTPEDTRKLQLAGLGGRRHFGAGVFVQAEGKSTWSR